MGHRESDPKRKIHSITDLPKRIQSEQQEEN